MNIPQSILAAFAAVAILFLLTKLMGNRQMSQLTLFDYVMGISIGSIAAEMAANPDSSAPTAIVGMAVFAAMDIGINLLNSKSRKLRSFFLGKPLVLLDNGALYCDNLRKAKLDLTEFLTECRTAGYFDPTQLQMVTMEVSGKLSFLPMEGQRPLTPSDMSLAPRQTRPPIPVIMDGILQPKNLQASGNNETWLQKQLKLQGFAEYDEIFLALVDTDNNCALFERNEAGTHKNHYT